MRWLNIVWHTKLLLRRERSRLSFPCVFIFEDQLKLESGFVLEICVEFHVDASEVFARVSLLKHGIWCGVERARFEVLGASEVSEVASVGLRDDGSRLFRHSHFLAVFKVANFDASSNVELRVDQSDVRNVQGVLLLEGLCALDHLLVLHFLKLHVDALDDNLVLIANDLDHLALRLLVATSDDLNLYAKAEHD